MEALMFLTQKRNGAIKLRMVYNGKPTCDWLSREESTSTTASLENIPTTAVIGTHEEADKMSADVPNAFIQTDITHKNERMIMKITGVLVHLPVEMAPELYGRYVVYDNGRTLLYVEVIRALYGMLVTYLIWYNKLCSDLEDIGFEFNPYDPFVDKRMVNDKQYTIIFHVDDLLSSYIDSKANDLFFKWPNKIMVMMGKPT